MLPQALVMLTGKVNLTTGGFILGSFTLQLVEHVVEDEQRLDVASVDDRADSDS